MRIDRYLGMLHQSRALRCVVKQDGPGTTARAAQTQTASEHRRGDRDSRQRAAVRPSKKG